MPDASTQCIAFLTHVWSPAIARHFDRLKREAGTVMPVYLLYQQPDNARDVPAEMQPDLIIRSEDYRARFPTRSSEIKEAIHLSGHVDLPWLTALQQPMFAGYEDIWTIENDVDFSGHWSKFFRTASTYEGDLLSGRVYHLSDNPGFWFAPTLRHPPSAPFDPLIAFMPIARLSRRAITTYAETITDPKWGGHSEILMPSVLQQAGLVVADLGGHGPLTPVSRVGRHYNGRLDSSRNDGSTFGFNPPRGFAYFVDHPERFLERNRLYHPIKTELAPEQQEKLARLRRVRWWTRMRRTLFQGQTRGDRFRM